MFVDKKHFMKIFSLFSFYVLFMPFNRVFVYLNLVFKEKKRNKTSIPTLSNKIIDKVHSEK